MTTDPHFDAAGLRDDAAVYDDDARHAEAQAAGPVSAAARASLLRSAESSRKRAATTRAAADALDTRDTPPAECIHDAADALQCRAEAYAGRGMDAHAARFYAAAAAVRETMNDGPTAAELASALRGTLRALETHISDDAAREGVTPDRLCPCTGDECATARATLARIDAS